MLTQRLLTTTPVPIRSLAAPLSSSTCHSLRTFTSTCPLRRAPSLTDITPDGAPEFDARQRDFRAKTAAAQRAREQRDSQSSATASSSSSLPSSSSTSSTSSSSEQHSSALTGLGSLSTHSVEEEAARKVARAKNEDENAQPKRKGALSSLIYGTHEGQQMDHEIEKSFSQVLARGKYVHSIVFHQVKPDKVDEYVKLVGGWYPKMASMEGNKVNLVGSWRTEVGDCDTFVHIWEYQRYHGYHASLHSISQHPDFPSFDARLKTLITSKNTSLMQEFSFWPTSPPRQLGGLFELRSYTLHPGNLLEWETHWRRGLKARREVMEGVGAWFVQVGDLNTVHHLWQFADLEERKVRRERSWGVEGWGETVHKTVPLIQTMRSRVLIPMPWSPVA
ncbi:MAG: hypothetical protein M1817_003845 [Caeruleum heppii]|nr:MAG: hypothetical protein M1817_003845 [Caeruleum heppii]